MERTQELAALDMANRPSIPVAIKRAVEEEAGYRCAIPTCRDKGPFDFEHIDEWSKVEKHEFHNIILLCVSCHARVTRKNTVPSAISKNSLRTYKRNLAIINGRYSLLEMRLLKRYFEDATYKNGEIRVEERSIFFVTDLDLVHLDGLLSDGYILAKPVKHDDVEFSKAMKSLLKKDESAENVGGATDEFVTKLPTMIENRAQFIVFPTEDGLKFVNDYFEGNEIK